MLGKGEIMKRTTMTALSVGMLFLGLSSPGFSAEGRKASRASKPALWLSQNEDLGLSGKQVDALRKIHEDMDARLAQVKLDKKAVMKSLNGARKKQDFAGAREQAKKLGAFAVEMELAKIDAEAKALSVLTSDQKKKLGPGSRRPRQRSSSSEERESEEE